MRESHLKAWAKEIFERNGDQTTSIGKEPFMGTQDKEAGSVALTATLNRLARVKVPDVFIVLAAAWAARLTFMYIFSLAPRSFDAIAWQTVADQLRDGINPYQASVFISWPPLWMQIIFAISRIAGFLHVPFFRVLQIVLMLIESAVIAQVFRLIKMIAPAANARAIVLVGLALNPVAILLTCQHCNFDVIMVLWVLLAAKSLVRFHESHNLIDWLCACLFLGLGILTKTVPLALVPLLAGGFRKATAECRLLGAALVLGPAALGMSVIYVLTPSAVFNHVLEYRAKGDSFGFPGFLHLLGIDNFTNFYDRGFYVLGVGIMALTWRNIWSMLSLGDRETILYIALVLLAIPVLGPGFAGQYCYWFLPFMVTSYACYPGLWQKLLVGLAFITAITFIIEYGLNSAYGSNFSFIFFLPHTRTIGNWETWMDLPSHDTIERIPLFIGFLTVLAFGARMLLISLNAPHKWIRMVAGCCALYILTIFGLGLGAKWLGRESATAGNSNSTGTARTLPSP